MDNKKLVLTDGTYYYESTLPGISFFTDNPQKAWNFYKGHTLCQSHDNEKRRLQWELDNWTKGTPIAYNERKTKEKIDRSKFHLKWITIIETYIKEENFNF